MRNLICPDWGRWNTVTKVSDMPALRAEDDGFLLQLKWSVLEKHIETLGIGDCETLDDCVGKILKDSQEATDKGSQLPLYIPFRDDDGIIQGCSAKPVWSGTHVDIPLYGNLRIAEVRELITGNRLGSSHLYEGFMAYSPAFRVALLVHHICQVVLMHPLAAEAFVLGHYGELPFEDKHFESFGAPSTDLLQVESNLGLRTEWMAKDPDSLSGKGLLAPRINGWRIRVRGSQPKESLLQEAWQCIRDQLDMPREVQYTAGGKKMVNPDPAPSGRSRKRVDSPEVDTMVGWIRERIDDGTFPMRGKFKDWKRAAALFAQDFPSLSDRWSSEAMRKAYERRRRRGY